MAINQALVTEVQTDPLGLGYAGMTDQQVADSLNTVNRPRNRTSMTGREVQDEVVDAEYDLLTDEKKSQFLALTASADLDPFGLGANVVKDIFGAVATTTTNLATARVETVSRAVEIGAGRVGNGTVEIARAQ